MADLSCGAEVHPGCVLALSHDSNLPDPAAAPGLEARVSRGTGKLARTGRVLLALTAAGACIQVGRELPAGDRQLHAAEADVYRGASDRRERTAVIRSSTTEALVYGEITRAHLARTVMACAAPAELVG